ncbi:unnamed protein product [marine sediment metagenome]|uniref:Uncharacterized protein n=1 Tax=marine sediment metagenome TaxID=412755 RepID=X0RZL3_9ZZZZ
MGLIDLPSYEELQLKVNQLQADNAQLEVYLNDARNDNAKLQAENEKLKEALELAYEAYKDKCTGKLSTAKRIAKVHRLCKQALKTKKI